MKHVFLSYTYRPHPAHGAETDTLERTVRRVIETMDLRVVDGRDLGGRVLDTEVDSRIRNADAFIALVTPQADAQGQVTLPEFVGTEFQTARVLDKPRVRVLHKDLFLRGLGAAEEYALFDPTSMLDIVMKLLATIALWKRYELRNGPADILFCRGTALSRTRLNLRWSMFSRAKSGS